MSSLRRARAWTSRLDLPRYLVVLLVAGGVAELASVARFTLRGARPPLDADSAMLQHIGWYMTQGGVPYVDMWDVKPPLAHETAAVFALVSGGDPLVQHYVGVLATALAAVAVVALVGALTFELTGEEVPAVAAGLVVLGHPAFHYFPAFGYRVKFFALAFGLGAIFLERRDHRVAAGVLAAASPAYWQFGLVFAFVVLAAAATDRDALAPTVLGMGLTTAVVLAPVVYLGAVGPMLEEVILTGVVVPEPGSPLVRLARGFLFFGYLAPVAAVAGYGVLAAASERIRETWWVAALTGWFAVQLIFLDFDAAPDLLPAVVAVALGTGLFVARLDGRRRRAVFAVVAAIAVVSVVWLGSLGFVARPLGREVNDDVVTRQALVAAGEALTGHSVTEPPTVGGKTRGDFGLPPIETIYWERIVPSTCHYRLSNMEIQWIEATSDTYTAKRCGTVNRVF